MKISNLKSWLLSKHEYYKTQSVLYGLMAVLIGGVGAYTFVNLALSYKSGNWLLQQSDLTPKFMGSLSFLTLFSSMAVITITLTFGFAIFALLFYCWHLQKRIKLLEAKA